MRNKKVVSAHHDVDCSAHSNGWLAGDEVAMLCFAYSLVAYKTFNSIRIHPICVNNKRADFSRCVSNTSVSILALTAEQ